MLRPKYRRAGATPVGPAGQEKSARLPARALNARGLHRCIPKDADRTATVTPRRSTFGWMAGSTGRRIGGAGANRYPPVTALILSFACSLPGRSEKERPFPIPPSAPDAPGGLLATVGPPSRKSRYE